MAAPLAVGNPLFVKPGEDAPIACGLLAAEALREAGLPDGVLDVATNARKNAAGVAEVLIAARASTRSEPHRLHGPRSKWAARTRRSSWTTRTWTMPSRP